MAGGEGAYLQPASAGRNLELLGICHAHQADGQEAPETLVGQGWAALTHQGAQGPGGEQNDRGGLPRGACSSAPVLARILSMPIGTMCDCPWTTASCKVVYPGVCTGRETMNALGFL